MKLIRRSIVTLGILAAASAAQPSVANSGIQGHIQFGSGGSYGHSRSIRQPYGSRGYANIGRLQRFYHRPIGYGQHNHRLHRHPNRRRPTLSYGYRAYRNYQGLHTYGYGGSSYRRSCHPVSKLVYGAYGHRKRIRGTMCYDKSGYGYVVPGSRRVVGYY